MSDQSCTSVVANRRIRSQSPRFPESLFLDALAGTDPAIPIQIERAIATAAGSRGVVAARGLDLTEYAGLGKCEASLEPVPPPAKYSYWGGPAHDRLFDKYEQAVWHVRWRGASLWVVEASWSTSCGGESRSWVVAETSATAEEFLLDAHRTTNDPGESILVFTGGNWRRSRDLYCATQTASFDDLIMCEQLKASIRSDFRQFLGAGEHYHRLGLSWRRGALFIGPPGNGKTHCVRALVKELNVPSLYVQSLSHRYYTAEQLWEMVFDRARQLRPCVLVLEDLDSLVDGKSRSYFLNQLDGFERNDGLLVLATTNYPERIDPAIIDRPSRFDRKYHFGLPTAEHRRRYLQSWQARIAHETRWSDGGPDDIVGATEGFSFAYLKELMVSSLMAWLADASRPFTALAREQADLLRLQMATEDVAPPNPDEDE